MSGPADETTTVIVEAQRDYKLALKAILQRAEAFGSPSFRDACDNETRAIRAAFDRIPALIAALADASSRE